MRRCSYERLLVCMKVFVESCSLLVLADGYEEKTKEQEGSVLLIFMIYIALSFETAQR